MNTKDIGKNFKTKFSDAMEDLPGPRGIETSVEILYDSLIKVKSLVNMLFKIVGIMGFIILFLAGALIYRISTNPYVPYAIRISESGAINGQTLTQASFTVDDNIMQFFLIDFIKKTRTLYKDKNFYNKQVQDKLAFLTPESKQQFESLIQTKTDTVSNLRGNITTSITIDSFLKVENNRYQINYTEIAYGDSGAIVKMSKYSTLVTTGTVRVTNDNMVRMNPAGIVITSFDISLINSTTDSAAILRETQQKSQNQSAPSTAPVPVPQTTVTPTPAPTQPQPQQPAQNSGF